MGGLGRSGSVGGRYEGPRRSKSSKSENTHVTDRSSGTQKWSWRLKPLLDQRP